MPKSVGHLYELKYKLKLGSPLSVCCQDVLSMKAMRLWPRLEPFKNLVAMCAKNAISNRRESAQRRR